MNHLRLVVLDYAKKQLTNSLCKKALSDLIMIKQMNFERTDPNYIVMDKHDMIGTHYMIYDTSNLYSPKLIFAIRTTYEDRAHLHKLKTPLIELSSKLDLKSQSELEAFRSRQKVLVDCNSWFVDPLFSKKETGLDLSNIGYLAVYLNISRMKLNNIAGCTNERYKASRWLENIGAFSKEHMFLHPIVNDPHMMILIENFHKSFLQNIFLKHSNLIMTAQEILPDNNTPTLYQVATDIFTQDTKLKMAS